MAPGLKIIVGRNQVENEQIKRLAGPGDAVFRPLDFRGPTALAQGILSAALEQTIGRIMARYYQDERESFTLRKRVRSFEETEFTVDSRFSLERLEEMRIGDAGVDFGRPIECVRS